jgi:hypothetical protein
MEGNSKFKESFRNLLSARSIFKASFGVITITCAPPINLSQHTEASIECMNRVGLIPPRLEFPPDIERETKVACAERERELYDPEFLYDPFQNQEHRKHFNRALGYRITYAMQQVGEASPTHLVATLLLMYRQGITKHQLVNKVHWLRAQVRLRGESSVGCGSAMQGVYRMNCSAVQCSSGV